MALVYIRPDADTDDGDWVNASGNNTNLYDSVNESVASNSDYIRSGNNPVNDIVKLRLGDFASVPAEPMTVRYRFKKVVSAGEILSLKVRLVEGDAPGTTIAEWEHDGVSETYTDGEQELTSGQFALVSDFDDLYLEFEAISGELVVIVPGPFDGSYLLTDEDEGFAINAMYPGDPTYAGESVGGSVAVVGDGSNNLDDVPLDSSNLTQAGTSAKTVHWHEAPYVRWSPHNYFTQSQTLDHSDWNTYATNCTVTANTSVAPDGTTTADTLTATAGGVAFINSGEANEPVAHVPYTYSAYLKQGTETWAILYFDDNTGGSVYCYYDLANGVLGTSGSNIMTLISTAIVSAGNGWWRCSITFEPNDAGAGIRRNRIHIADADGDDSPAASATILAWGVQKNRGPIALPYLVTTSAHRIGIPQSYDINEDMFGVLIEPAATNLATNSEVLGSWSATASTVSSNAATAPDGATTADKNIPNNTNEAHYLSQGPSGSTSSNTLSIYAKPAGYDYVALMVWASGSNNYTTLFNVSTGTAVDTASTGTVTSSSNTITEVGNGWYRCSVTASLGGAAGSFFLVSAFPTASLGGTPTPTFSGNGTDGVYLWGGQYETGSAATSYIPTLSSTVTRAADSVSAAIGTFPCDLTQGIFIGMGKINDASAGYNTLIGSNIGGNEFIRMQSDDTNLAEIVEGSDDATATTGTGNWDTAARKAATAYTASGLAAAFEGGAINTESFSPDYSGVTYIHIGSRGGATLHWNGYIYQVTYLPRARVNDAELIAMSEGL